MKTVFFLLLIALGMPAFGQYPPERAPVIKGKKVASVLQYDVKYLTFGTESGMDLHSAYYYNKSGLADSHKIFFEKDNLPCNYFVFNTYDTDGLLVKTVSLDCGKEQQSICKYDNHKRIVELIDERSETKSIYSYDNAGNISCMRGYGLDGKLFSRDSIIYNNKNKPTLHINIIENEREDNDYYYYYTYTAFDSVEYRYDISKLKKAPYTTTGLAVTHYTYDNNNRILTYTFKGTDREFSYKYSYDPDGAYVLTESELGGSSISVYSPEGLLLEVKNRHGYITKYTYNNRGLLLRVVTHDKDNKISHSEVYEYTYW